VDGAHRPQCASPPNAAPISPGSVTEVSQHALTCNSLGALMAVLAGHPPLMSRMTTVTSPTHATLGRRMVLGAWPQD
jgi:hypothetical protein